MSFMGWLWVASFGCGIGRVLVVRLDTGSMSEIDSRHPDGVMAGIVPICPRWIDANPSVVG